MAMLLIAKHGLNEAQESLKLLLRLKEIHRSEWQALIGAQIVIIQTEGDFSVVARLRTMLRDFDHSHK
ncbi:MAG: hypothetical protein LBI59_03060 [Candidatus Accumulibacter sp.]|jgi:hypothetical protein|nr:hypothetical protein [Accumulibacter sp.]